MMRPSRPARYGWLLSRGGGKEAARDLGVCIDTLRSWLKGAGMQMGQVGRHNRDRQRIRELEAELRSLRKQRCEKDEIIDILKKSVGILSKP